MNCVESEIWIDAFSDQNLILATNLVKHKLGTETAKEKKKKTSPSLNCYYAHAGN